MEFWPDYEPAGPLWSDDGKPVDPITLGCSSDLAARLSAWNAAYREDRLPTEGQGDAGYVQEGVRLLAEVRRAVGDRARVVVTEPWWGEPVTDV